MPTNMTAKSQTCLLDLALICRQNGCGGLLAIRLHMDDADASNLGSCCSSAQVILNVREDREMLVELSAVRTSYAWRESPLPRFVTFTNDQTLRVRVDRMTRPLVLRSEPAFLAQTFVAKSECGTLATTLCAHPHCTRVAGRASHLNVVLLLE